MEGGGEASGGRGGGGMTLRYLQTAVTYVSRQIFTCGG